ncbi:dehydrogenase/reductase SDR family member 13-like [Eublepharis macularius]|uniref:Dehydrogenase/reductase SDR family member 13-like n=1 Tax=Eublepharis macularius TaxID=481883 RepID=A0AA97LJL3_EUBMA|nr:dehydrogenase/reductase SDR family member 13-like [Eublepharis macularius]
MGGIPEGDISSLKTPQAESPLGRSLQLFLRLLFSPAAPPRQEETRVPGLLRGSPTRRGDWALGFLDGIIALLAPSGLSPAQPQAASLRPLLSDGRSLRKGPVFGEVPFPGVLRPVQPPEARARPGGGGAAFILLARRRHGQRARQAGMAAAAVLAGLALLAGLYLWYYYKVVRGPKCPNETRLRGKTVLLTGGNSGIGKATALELARRGARVILACRNKERAESAVHDIRRESGNNEVVSMSLDLANLSSVQSFVDAFLKSEPRLDILINNAGVENGGTSPEGFNLAFQVNYLSHFLLTHLLLDRLKHCAPTRVVVLGSIVYIMGRIDLQNIQKPVDGLLKSFQAYCNSKLANILYTRELAKRLEGTGITCYAVDPGLVKTGIFRQHPIWAKLLLDTISWLFFRDPVNGAQTSIYCATQKGIERFSGHYFANCKVQEPFPKARDDAVAKKLWEFTERMLGIVE